MLNYEKEVGFIWDIDGVVVDTPTNKLGETPQRDQNGESQT